MGLTLEMDERKLKLEMTCSGLLPCVADSLHRRYRFGVTRPDAPYAMAYKTNTRFDSEKYLYVKRQNHQGIRSAPF